ncbi:MAG: proton-translocating NADH-quinone oxidoreductase subunit N, partial [Verrucomicrobia bacterium]|nr:proton-translocating NADH-quinone oxidoreductase subunit N [Verrucomicrobiota bacterium]
MNTKLIQTEIWVLLIGLAALLLDLWVPARRKAWLGYFVASGLGLVLIAHFGLDIAGMEYLLLQDDNLSRLISVDSASIFLKRIFLVAAIFIVLVSVSYSKRFETGVGEYFVLLTFALLGMLFAAGARHFAMMFVSVELITVSFYVLVSFNRNRLASVEAGIKYLILGALSSSVLIFGMALVYASAGSMDLSVLKLLNADQASDPLFLIGLLFIFCGLSFKIALVPFQFWAPDVYQGAPTPTTAFLAIGSKAAGIILMLRFIYDGLPFNVLPLREFLF